MRGAKIVIGAAALLFLSPAYGVTETAVTEAATRPTDATNFIDSNRTGFTFQELPTTTPTAATTPAAIPSTAVIADPFGAPATNQASPVSTEAVSLVERYRRGNSQATQLAFSPTAVLLPDGVSRFGMTEIVLLQYNAGIGDWVQVGLNTTWFATIGGDVKVKFTEPTSPHQFAVLAGAGIKTFDYRDGWLYVRPAYSYLHDIGDGRVALFNASLTYGSEGSWMEGDAGYEYKCGSCPPTRTGSTIVELFQPDEMFSGVTAGLEWPWQSRRSMSWLVEGALGTLQLDKINRETYGAAIFAGVRYRGEARGLQVGLLRPFFYDWRDVYALGIPVVDFSWTFE